MNFGFGLLIGLSLFIFIFLVLIAWKSLHVGKRSKKSKGKHK